MVKSYFLFCIFVFASSFSYSAQYSLNNGATSLRFNLNKNLKLINKNKNRIFISENNETDAGPATVIFIGTIDPKSGLKNIDEGIMRAYSYEYFDIKKNQILKDKGLMLVTRPYEVLNWQQSKNVGSIGVTYSDVDAIYDENSYFIKCKGEYSFVIKELIPDKKSKKNLKKFKDSVSC